MIWKIRFTFGVESTSASPRFECLSRPLVASRAPSPRAVEEAAPREVDDHLARLVLGHVDQRLLERTRRHKIDVSRDRDHGLPGLKLLGRGHERLARSGLRCHD